MLEFIVFCKFRIYHLLTKVLRFEDVHIFDLIIGNFEHSRDFLISHFVPSFNRKMDEYKVRIEAVPAIMVPFELLN